MAQTSGLPPELVRPAKSWTPPSEPAKELAEAMGIGAKDSPQLSPSDVVQKLTTFIEQNPNYSDGYYFRASENFCTIKDKNYASIVSDFDAAIDKSSQTVMPAQTSDLADLRAMRARVELLTGKYREAMSDLDSAIKLDPGSAQNIFGAGGVTPDGKGDGCAWGLDDFNELQRQYPNDFRINIYRGLYLAFFATFDETFRDRAIQDLQKADSLNPKSPLTAFLLGQIYTRSSMFGLAAAKSDTIKDATIRKAAQQYTVAIQRDPSFFPAYGARAESYFELREYLLAIKDYDADIAREPDNAGAYNDRGLVEMELGRYAAATVDFGDALSRLPADDHSIGQTYENRADVYIKEGEYARAVADLNEAIAENFGSQTLLMGIGRVRKLYPELSALSDSAVSDMLREIYWPQFTDDTFSKELLDKTKTWEPSFILADLYVKRGDSYLRMKDFRPAAADFSRVFSAFGDYGSSIDRWRPLEGDTNKAIFVDIKTMTFSPVSRPSLWIKTMGKKSSYTVDSYEFDCSSRSISQKSTIDYDANGNVIRSSEVDSRWQRVVPDSLGEDLFEGMCANPPKEK